MKKLLKLLTSRTVVVGMLIFLQVLFVLYVILFITSYSLITLLCLELLSTATVIWLVSNRENPSYKLAWVIVILSLPIVGIVFFVLFGNKRIGHGQVKKIKAFYKHAEPMFAQALQHNSALIDQMAMGEPHLARQAKYLFDADGSNLYRHTACQYCPLGEDFLELLLQELRQAKRFIFMEYFIIERGKMWDSILEVLQQKVREGVDVRVMYDDIGAINTLPTGYEKTLQAMGINARVFNPFRPHLSTMLNYRDHRKICVIDGNVGFTGGINLADEYINAYVKHGHWKDTAVLLRGDGVWSLTVLFLQLWYFSAEDSTFEFDAYRPTERYPSDGYVQPFGDSPMDNVNVAESCYMQIINTATRYVYITTPYLILDHEMVTALSIAAQSGVDVRIMTPSHPDKWFVHPVTRSFYGPLIRTGVKIYEYTPGFVHAKMFVSDDKVAIVGTANMDYRSFYLHFECGAAFYLSSMVSAVKQDVLQTLEQCTAITYEAAAGNIFVRLGRALLRIFAPLM